VQGTLAAAAQGRGLDALLLTTDNTREKREPEGRMCRSIITAQRFSTTPSSHIYILIN
jgi:hypothetical protein